MSMVGSVLGPTMTLRTIGNPKQGVVEMQGFPRWLGVLIIVIVVALIAFAGYRHFFGKPKWAEQMPVGETPAGEPIYRK